jgi:hypothetical protein
MRKLSLFIVIIMLAGSSVFANFGNYRLFDNPLKTTLSPSICTPAELPSGVNPFEQGRSIISVGYGFGNFSKAIFSVYNDYNDYSFKFLGPLHLKYEYAINNSLGFGLSLNYISYNLNWKYTYYNDVTMQDELYDESLKYNSLSVLVRLNHHFFHQNGLDIYWGAGLGYKHNNYTYQSDYDGTLNTTDLGNLFPVGFELTVGLRYFFTPNIGAYIEGGFAKSALQFGLCFGF